MSGSRERSELELREAATEVASEVLDAFSELHPTLSMPWNCWQDLREMIEREITGTFGEPVICAADLLLPENKR